jgi:hypothetical protein
MTVNSIYRNQWVIFFLFALIVSLIFTRGSIAKPNYTDAFYHFNAANRLVEGEGLTDPYLWTYIGEPEFLPAPSHLYWMPLTSLVAASGMWLLNSPNDYYAAQLLFTLMFAGTAMIAYWLGGKLGGGYRHRWVAGLLTLFSGFFTRFWGATDTFSPYAFVGSMALILIGLGATSLESANQNDPLKRPYRNLFTWFVAGVFTGLAHLTRADGLLLLLVGWVVIVWAYTKNRRQEFVVYLTLFILGYFLTMLPWFIRNLDQVGTILPIGGTQSIWYTNYNDLFNFPPDANANTFFSSGLNTLFESRWTAFLNNLGTFIAVEGLVVVTPLMLIGLWRRRRKGFLRPFWLYALGLHIAMTLVFPFPGFRGGLFHSSAALIPFWAALGVVGLDDAVNWMSKRRRTWNVATAKWIFSAGLATLAIALSLSNISNGVVKKSTPTLYERLNAVLPDNARVMINDPAQLYYYTGHGGVVLPNESPDVIPIIADKYGVTFLLIEGDGVPEKLQFDINNPPAFLESISPFERGSVRLYAINPP